MSCILTSSFNSLRHPRAVDMLCFVNSVMLRRMPGPPNLAQGRGHNGVFDGALLIDPLSFSVSHRLENLQLGSREKTIGTSRSFSEYPATPTILSQRKAKCNKKPWGARPCLAAHAV